MGIKKGTKLTDNPKNTMLYIRIDKETEQKLDEICIVKKKSKSDVVREGIDKQYAEIKK